MTDQTVSVSTSLLLRTQKMLTDFQNGETPFNDETSRLLAQVREALSQPTNDDVMKGFYRCEDCHHRWTVVDAFNDANDCPICTAANIEPYSSGDLSNVESDALYSLAQHERKFPAPDEFGTYTVEVHLTAFRIAKIEIAGSIGPATAELAALGKAVNITFSGDVAADYEVQGHAFEPAVEVGGHYLWNDPDTDTDCSGPVEVTGMVGEEIFCTHINGGGTLAALVGELSPLPQETVAEQRRG
jgi:hypothetical protein